MASRGYSCKYMSPNPPCSPFCCVHVGSSAVCTHRDLQALCRRRVLPVCFQSGQGMSTRAFPQ